MPATAKLYETDPYVQTFTATVLVCTPAGEQFAVQLDRTAFYPEGGGQPCDTGALGTALVTDVQEHGGVITHTVSAALPVGQTVEGRIDWARRRDHMEQHTGELTAPKAPAGLAAALAQKLGCVVLLSGTEDLIADGQLLCTVRGGSDRMRTVTGAGCMLSVLCGAFAAVQPGDAFTAAVQAARFWKACAEQAEDHAAGAGSFRVALFDAAGNMTDEVFAGE